MPLMSISHHAQAMWLLNWIQQFAKLNSKVCVYVYQLKQSPRSLKKTGCLQLPALLCSAWVLLTEMCGLLVSRLTSGPLCLCLGDWQGLVSVWTEQAASQREDNTTNHCSLFHPLSRLTASATTNRRARARISYGKTTARQTTIFWLEETPANHLFQEESSMWGICWCVYTCTATKVSKKKNGFS